MTLSDVLFDVIITWQTALLNYVHLTDLAVRMAELRTVYLA